MSCQGQATGTSFMLLGPVKRLFHSLIVLCSPNPHPIHTPHLWSLYFEEPHQLVILPEGVWRATGWSKHPWPVSELSFARSRNSLTLCKICRHKFPQPKPTWPRRGRNCCSTRLHTFSTMFKRIEMGLCLTPNCDGYARYVVRRCKPARAYIPR